MTKNDDQPTAKKKGKCSSGAGLMTETLSTKKKKTVRDLKGYVLNVLNNYDKDTAAIKVKLCDLRVFLKSDSKWKEIPDSDILVGGDTYVVYECYSILPMDMYRTVTTEQLVSAVFTHPANVSSWTKMSPIYCCSFTENEQNEPFESKKNNYPKINGVSLRCSDDTIPYDGDFSNPSLEALEKGNHSVSLESLQLRLPPGENYRNNNSGNSDFPEMGITLNSLTTEPDNVPINIWSKRRSPQLKKNNNGNLRSFFYVYVLKAGTDLGPHGMAVVRDNTSPGHCSLITDREFQEKDEWSYTGPGRKVLWPTIPSANIRENKKWHLLEEAWRRMNVPVLPFKIDYRSPAGKYYMAHPYVASLFVLHSFMIVASAKPLPLPSFEGKDDQCLLYEAAIVLFDNGCYQDERHAVDVLEKFSYDMTIIPEDDLQIVINSIDSILDVWNNKHDDDYDVDDLETLQQAVRVLNQAELRFDNASVPATNQMPTTPKKPPTKKPKTTRGPPRVVAKVLNVPEIETVLTDRTTPPSSEEKVEDEPSSNVPSMKVISGSSR